MSIQTNTPPINTRAYDAEEVHFSLSGGEVDHFASASANAKKLLGVGLLTLTAPITIPIAFATGIAEEMNWNEATEMAKETFLGLPKDVGDTAYHLKEALKEMF